MQNNVSSCQHRSASINLAQPSIVSLRVLKEVEKNKRDLMPGRNLNEASLAD